MQNERIVNKQKIGSSLDLVNHAITKNDTINMTFEVAHRLRNEGYSLIEFLDKFNLKYKFRDDLKKIIGDESNDNEMIELAKIELNDLESKKDKNESKLKLFLFILWIKK